MMIAAQSEHEVRELHRFFQDWFRGELAATDEAFARFADVLAPEFEIVAPDGKIMDRAAILAAVWGRHGTDRDFAIEIRHHRHRVEIGEVVLVTYEEWQTAGTGMRGRVGTAVLRVKAGKPNGVEWLQVSETWKG